MKIKCGGLTFISNFDSGNLARVAFVSSSSKTVPSSKVSISSSNRQSNQIITKYCSTEKPSDNKNELQKGKRRKSLASNSDLGEGNSTHPKLTSSVKFGKKTTRKTLKVLEFQVWTKPDCVGTQFENSFRSWFYFGIEGAHPDTLIKIHVMNLNRQGKLFYYGMSPVFKVVPGSETWQRIPEGVNYKSESGNFVVSFSHLLPPEYGTVTYFAFTYPFSYCECQQMLDDIDKRMGSSLEHQKDSIRSENSIYYSRELTCHSLDGRKVEVLTLTSYKGITENREARLPGLFPDVSKPRCHIFTGKKVVFLSSRVHPGETPSSFVFNGFLNALLCSSDQKAAKLRNLFVFKLVPMLNPDGVYRGHFRTDSRGVNLNRTYLIADPKLHPSVRGSRSLLMYYHELYSSVDQCSLESKDVPDLKVLCELTSAELLGTSFDLGSASLCLSSSSSQKPSCSCCHSCDNRENPTENCVELLLPGNLRSPSSVDSSQPCTESLCSGSCHTSPKFSNTPTDDHLLSLVVKAYRSNSDLEPSDAEEDKFVPPKVGKKVVAATPTFSPPVSKGKSGIAYYVDLHGHACKRGCFIYGNHFQELEEKVECMLLAKLISINCSYFDFPACNFTEENMHSGSKCEGQSKEGSGRVAFYTLTGNIHSYTLECNYNTGRNMVNSFECKPSSPGQVAIEKSTMFFTPNIFEQVGEALLISMLDASGHNPQSRLLCSAYGSLDGVRTWIRKYAKAIDEKKCQTPKKIVASIRLSKKIDRVPLPNSKLQNRSNLKCLDGPVMCKPLKKTKKSILSASGSTELLSSNLKSSFKKPTKTVLGNRTTVTKSNLSPLVTVPKKTATAATRASPLASPHLRLVPKKDRGLSGKKKKTKEEEVLNLRPSTSVVPSSEKLAGLSTQNKALSARVNIIRSKKATFKADQSSNRGLGF